MNYKLLIYISCFVLYWQPLNAQITQMEFISGLHSTRFSSFTIKPLNNSGSLSIASQAFFQKYHKEEDVPFDELGVQATVYWNFSKNVAIGPTLYHNSAAGFTERISVLIHNTKPGFSIVAIPAIIHNEKTKDINGEIFMQLQLTIPLKNNWQVLTYGQFISIWDKFNTHARSFQQIRIGLSHIGNQFGLATDFDQYGDQPTSKCTVGLFLRKVIVKK